MHIIETTRKYSGNTRAVLYFNAKKDEQNTSHNGQPKNCIKITQTPEHILFGFATIFCTILSFSCKVIAFHLI
jgi:hypothetical protein